MEFLPPAKSSRWFLWMTGYAVLLWLFFILDRFVLLGQPDKVIVILRFALFSFIISVILNTLGWLGARLVWLISTAGIVIGLVFMIVYSYRDMSGWGDLAGFLIFFQFMLGGFVLGLLAEGVRLLINRLRKT